MEDIRNRIFSSFLKNKDKYDLNWMEKINDESSLERELEIEKNNLENNKINFENEISILNKTDLEKDFIEADQYNKLIDLVFNENIINHVSTFYYCYPNIKETNIFKITRNADTITKIYLELEFDSIFEDISLSDKLNLLDGKVKLIIGGVEIFTCSILTCIFNAICTGHNIKCNNNIIQIPLFIFNTLIDFNIPGLPLISLKYHEVEISIKLKNKIENMTWKLLVHGIYLRDSKRTDLVKFINEFIIFQNSIYQQKIIDYLQKINIKYFHTKFILVYFTPIENRDDLFNEYPEIIEASLTTKKNIFWDSDNILSFEIFGIKIYVLPLSKDMSTWEKIQESLTNPIEKMSFNDIADYDIFLNIEITLSDNFYITVNEIVPNILAIMSGMCGLKYGT